MPLAFPSSRRPGTGAGASSGSTSATVGFGAVAAAAAFAFAVHKAARLRSPLGLSHWKSSIAEDGSVLEFEELLQHITEKGLDPEVRPEVWPLLLGMYGADETYEDRNAKYKALREGFEKLVRRCQELETACLEATSSTRRSGRPSSCCGGPQHSPSTATSASASPLYCKSSASNAVPYPGPVSASGTNSSSRRVDLPSVPASIQMPASPLEDSSSRATEPSTAASAGDWGEEVTRPGSAAIAGVASEACFLGHVSRTDVPPPLRPYWEAQQSIALDAVRIDFKKSLLPGATPLAAGCSSSSGGGGGRSINLRGLGFGSGGTGAAAVSASSSSPAGPSASGGPVGESAVVGAGAVASTAASPLSPTSSMAALAAAGGDGVAGASGVAGGAAVMPSGGNSGRITAWFKEKVEEYQAARAARQLQQQQQERGQQLQKEQQEQQQQQQEPSDGEVEDSVSRAAQSVSSGSFKEPPGEGSIRLRLLQRLLGNDKQQQPAQPQPQQQPQQPEQQPSQQRLSSELQLESRPPEQQLAIKADPLESEGLATATTDIPGSDDVAPQQGPEGDGAADVAAVADQQVQVQVPLGCLSDSTATASLGMVKPAAGATAFGDTAAADTVVASLAAEPVIRPAVPAAADYDNGPMDHSPAAADQQPQTTCGVTPQRLQSSSVSIPAAASAGRCDGPRVSADTTGPSPVSRLAAHFGFMSRIRPMGSAPVLATPGPSASCPCSPLQQQSGGGGGGGGSAPCRAPGSLVHAPDCSPGTAAASSDPSIASTPRYTSEGGTAASLSFTAAAREASATVAAADAAAGVAAGAGGSTAAGGGGGGAAAAAVAVMGTGRCLSAIARYHLEHATHFSTGQMQLVGRLITLLSAYAVHDEALGYCQGMSDLALPFVLLLEDDVTAFWCFVRLMTRVRGNFLPRADGAFERLATLGSLLAALDPALGTHLRGLRADHCHFAVRMVTAQMRRELPAELAVRLWEQLWADDLLEELAARREAARERRERSRAAEEGAVELSDMGAFSLRRRGTEGPEAAEEEAQPAVDQLDVEVAAGNEQESVAVMVEGAADQHDPEEEEEDENKGEQKPVQGWEESAKGVKAAEAGEERGRGGAGALGSVEGTSAPMAADSGSGGAPLSADDGTGGDASNALTATRACCGGGVTEEAAAAAADAEGPFRIGGVAVASAALTAATPRETHGSSCAAGASSAEMAVVQAAAIARPACGADVSSAVAASSAQLTHGLSTSIAACGTLQGRVEAASYSEGVTNRLPATADLTDLTSSLSCAGPAAAGASGVSSLAAAAAAAAAKEPSSDIGVSAVTAGDEVASRVCSRASQDSDAAEGGCAPDAAVQPGAAEGGFPPDAAVQPGAAVPGAWAAEACQPGPAAEDVLEDSEGAPTPRPSDSGAEEQQHGSADAPPAAVPLPPLPAPSGSQGERGGGDGVAPAAAVGRPAFCRDLFLYLIASVVLSQKKKVLECGELDDVHRLFHSLPLSRSDVTDALKRAREYRDRVAPRPRPEAAPPAPPPASVMPAPLAPAPVPVPPAAPSLRASLTERTWRLPSFRSDPPAAKL